MSTPIKFFPSTHAVLAQFKTANDLVPVSKGRAPALLEVMGRPVVHHWLDRLAVAGVKHVKIVCAEFPEQIRGFVNRGERWGFETVEYVSTRPFDTWQFVQAKVPEAVHSDTVYCSLNAFPVEPLHLLANSEDFWTEREGGGRNNLVAFPINSLNSLWLINMETLQKRSVKHLEPGSILDESTRLEGAIQVDQRVVVREQCCLVDSIVGKDVDIGESTEIRQSLILGNTLLGSHLNLQRVIVDGPFVYDVDTKRQLHLSDAALFSRLIEKNSTVSLFERTLASLLLLVTLPIWIISKTSKNVVEFNDGVDLQGKAVRKQVNVSNIDSGNQFARRIPWLFQVIKGQLPLFGSRETAACLTSRPGVISATDFTNQTDSDIALANVCQQQQNLTENLALAGLWLPKVFQRRS
jgi:hypothetical protein